MWLIVIGMMTGSVVPAAAQFNNTRAARPEVNLPGGPVRHVILKRCTACHGIDDYAYHAMDRAGWQTLVSTMVDKGAVIPQEDESVLLDWLVTEFGPDSTPFLRGYIAPVDSALFADDEAAGDYLETTCSSCHGLDRVDTVRYGEGRWRAIVVDMQTRGAPVADENVEALVEYLTRTRGEG